MSQKRLFLLRHAQAASSKDGQDKSRTLTPQGKEDAKALGHEMKRRGFVPDYVLCSSSMRTKQTLEGVQLALNIPHTQFLDILYHGTTGQYLHEIQKMSDDYNHILLVAHNPTIYDLVRFLGGDGSDMVMQRLSEGYQPATLSVIECTCASWADIQPKDNTLASIMNLMDYNAPARPTRWM